MKRVLTIFLLFCSFLSDAGAEEVQIPDPLPVAIEVTNVVIEGSTTVRQFKTHEIRLIPLAEWTKLYGPLTAADIRQYSTLGVLRRSTVLYHVTL